MTLKNERELTNTREKLRELEQDYEELRNDSTEHPHVREVTMESLKRMINQLKEEITRYEVRQPSRC